MSRRRVRRSRCRRHLRPASRRRQRPRRRRRDVHVSPSVPPGRVRTGATGRRGGPPRRRPVRSSMRARAVAAGAPARAGGARVRSRRGGRRHRAAANASARERNRRYRDAGASGSAMNSALSSRSNTTLSDRSRSRPPRNAALDAGANALTTISSERLGSGGERRSMHRRRGHRRDAERTEQHRQPMRPAERASEGGSASASADRDELRRRRRTDRVASRRQSADWSDSRARPAHRSGGEPAARPSRSASGRELCDHRVVERNDRLPNAASARTQSGRRPPARERADGRHEAARVIGTRRIRSHGRRT